MMPLVGGISADARHLAPARRKRLGTTGLVNGGVEGDVWLGWSLSVHTSGGRRHCQGILCPSPFGSLTLKVVSAPVATEALLVNSRLLVLAFLKRKGICS